MWEKIKEFFTVSYEYTPETCPQHEGEYLGCDVGHICKHCGEDIVVYALSKGEHWSKYMSKKS